MHVFFLTLPLQHQRHSMNLSRFYSVNTTITLFFPIIMGNAVVYFKFQKGDAAIHLAARNGFTEVIDKLLRHGDNLNRTNQVWPRGYKTFFMLNSTEHEFFPAHKC